VVVVASTVVSKAEGRTFDLSDFPARARAEAVADRLAEIAGEEKDPRFAQAVIEESTELIMEAPFLLTATRFGHIGVNAGIDQSNVPDGDLLLLPERPPRARRAFARGSRPTASSSATPAGARSDTASAGSRSAGPGSRPAATGGGERDRDGREMGVTVQNVIDELASAANLVAGEGDGGTPVVVVRDWEFGDHDGSDNHFREVEGDFVRQALRQWTFDD